MPHPDLGAMRADIVRLWDVAPSDEEDLAADAWELLDRATAFRRQLSHGPDWSDARLCEGLARLLVTRQVAAWGNRSYALQALEASMDGLRDAIIDRADDARPSAVEVTAFRDALVREWRAGQSEPELDRFASLSIPVLRRISG